MILKPGATATSPAKSIASLSDLLNTNGTKKENAATRIPTAHPPARRYAAAQKRFTSSRWHRLQYFAVPSAINQAHLRAFIAICPRTLRDDCEAHFLDRIPSVYFDGFHNVTYKEEWKLPVHGQTRTHAQWYEKDFQTGDKP